MSKMNSAIFRPRGLSAWIFAIGCLAAHQASATVIYLDVNNNPDERSAYQRALRSAGQHEHFVSIPAQNEELSDQLSTLAQHRDELWVEYTNQGCLAEVATHAPAVGVCGPIEKALRASEQRVAQLPKQPLNAATLRAGLQALPTTDGDSITLSISGHFGGGVFTGNLGSMSVDEIAQVFGEFPRLKGRITTLHLLGCYTNTLWQVSTMWRKDFPSARVLAGFYERSPAGGDTQNLRFITFLVRQKAAFDEVKTESEFHWVMRSFKRFADIHTALSIDDFYQQGRGSLQRVSNAASDASVCVAHLSPAERDYFASVMRGDTAIPANTGSSRLRRYYSALRDNAVCLTEPPFLTLEIEVPQPDQVIRLILYKNVVANFRRLHAADIATFDITLAAIGVGPELQMERVDMNSRKQVLSWRQSLQTKLGTIADHDQAVKVLNDLKGFSDVLIDLQPSCVPLGWVEPDGFQSSSCFQVKN